MLQNPFLNKINRKMLHYYQITLMFHHLTLDGDVLLLSSYNTMGITITNMHVYTYFFYRKENNLEMNLVFSIDQILTE